MASVISVLVSSTVDMHVGIQQLHLMAILYIMIGIGITERPIQMTPQVIKFYGSQFNDILTSFEKLRIESKPFGEGTR